jgi:Protein of unknown function (DUF4013)
MTDSNTDSNSASYTFGDNLTYMFKEPKWISKILIGALLGLVPILNFVTGGYALRVLHNIRNDQEPSLPEWGAGFGKYFMDGLFLFLIGLIYSIPLMLIGMISGVPMALLGSTSNRDNLAALFGAASCLVGLIGLVYLVLMVFWLQGAIVNYVVKGNFGAAFAFGEIWAIVKANTGKMVLTVVAVVVASFVVGLVGGVLAFIPCCGWIVAWLISFAAAFYILLVMSYTCGFIAKTV